MSKAFKLKPIEPLERDIQAAILRYLACDPRVAWHHRFNVGAQRVNGTDANGRPTRRFIRYAFKGCSDILGQVVTGHLLAVEVKRPGEGPSDEQAAFLERVAGAGGLAVLAFGIDDVREALAGFEPLAGIQTHRMMAMPEAQISRAPSALAALLARKA